MAQSINSTSEDDPNSKELVVGNRPSASSRGVVIFGLAVVGVIFVGLGVWSATAPLAKAVPAAATLSVKGERKTIQHFEGGIIGSIHVTEGQLVSQGQLLIALDPVQASASAARHNGQLNQALAREARLESELRDERSIQLSGQLLERLAKTSQVIEILEAEEKHLLARRETVDGTIAILEQRIEQLENEIKGLEIQKKSTKKLLKLYH